MNYLQERLATGRSIAGFERDLTNATGGALVPLGEGSPGGAATKPRKGQRKPATRRMRRSG